MVGAKEPASGPTPNWQTASYSPRKWEEMRPIITQLYFVEDKTLRELKEILADQHDFHPTYVGPLQASPERAIH